jgi:hypothetical protein
MMYFTVDHTDTVLANFADACEFVPVSGRIWIWYRAGGDVICQICKKKYYEHPPEEDPKYCTTYTEHWKEHFLRILCNGDRVHL